MPSTPFFSVIIPLYNKEIYISGAINSLLAQTFSDFEIILINDGSTDFGFEIAKKKLSNQKNTTLLSQENQGLSAARNNAIGKSRGQYIALLDADDEWLPHHLEQLYALINEYPNAGLYSTGYSLKKSEHIFHRAKFNDLPKNFRGIVPNFFKHSLQNCVAWVGAVCFPRKVFDDVDGFDPEIYSEQDTDLYIKIALIYDVALDDTSFSAISNRTQDDNMSSFSNKKHIPKLLYTYKNEELKDKHLKKYMDYNRFSTIIYFKLSSNQKLAQKLMEDMDFNSLNFMQRILLKLPNIVIKLLFFIKTKLKLNALKVFKPNET
ncbi:glycosyltransferase family 2 protein [Hyunsoonleella rubra]|uniref:Glycosyltransferase family 2 protein n=1 Tax=Hyunsoonleella rubra TaxID=1737062 RepID=A0ABW5T8W6_9FLAO